MSGHVNDSMDKDSIMDSEDRIEKMVDIYVSAEAVRDMKHKKDKEDLDNQTPKTQIPQHTESDSVKSRSSRTAVVCLVLLCVLLLTAVIVLCVHIYTNNTNYTQETNQLLTKINSLTEQRNQILTNNTNLTEERDQLLTNIADFTKERDELIKRNMNLTNEREQLRNKLQICVGWTCYQSSFYYIANTTKNWTESRIYCTEREADLIIINSREEYEFVKNISGSAAVYIGLTETDVEGSWKWVDGSTLTSGSWATEEPTKGKAENCVLTVGVAKPEFLNLVGWHDVACNRAFQWICEKSISKLMLP